MSNQASGRKADDSRKSLGIQSRRTPRRGFARPLGILFRGKYNVVQGLQLSEGGMLFSVPASEKFAPKDKIIATVLIPGGGTVVTRAEVLYEQDGAPGTRCFGAKFSDLSLQLRRLIRNYVAAKTQEEVEREDSGEGH